MSRQVPMTQREYEHLAEMAAEESWGDSPGAITIAKWEIDHLRTRIAELEAERDRTLRTLAAVEQQRDRLVRAIREYQEPIAADDWTTDDDVLASDMVEALARTDTEDK